MGASRLDTDGVGQGKNLSLFFSFPLFSEPASCSLGEPDTHQRLGDPKDEGKELTAVTLYYRSTFGSLPFFTLGLNQEDEQAGETSRDHQSPRRAALDVGWKLAGNVEKVLRLAQYLPSIGKLERAPVAC